jgi:hypothetical protein
LSHAEGATQKQIADDLALVVVMLCLRGDTLEFSMEERLKAREMMGSTVCISKVVGPGAEWKFGIKPMTGGNT